MRTIRFVLNRNSVSYLWFSGPGLIGGVRTGCRAEEGGTTELAQRSNVRVTSASGALTAWLHGRMPGYANATLTPSGCYSDTYGVCQP